MLGVCIPPDNHAVYGLPLRSAQTHVNPGGHHRFPQTISLITFTTTDYSNQVINFPRWFLTQEDSLNSIRLQIS